MPTGVRRFVPAMYSRRCGSVTLSSARWNLIGLCQQRFAHRDVPPARDLEKPLVVVPELDERGRQHLVEALEGADDGEEFLQRVVDVSLAEELHELLGARQRERDGE